MRLFPLWGMLLKRQGQVTQTDIRIATMLMDQMRLQGQARKRRRKMRFEMASMQILILKSVYKNFAK